MWKFLLLAMFVAIAVLVIRKQQKRKNPRTAESKQLIEKVDVADIFGEDLLDLSQKYSG
jgi:preprotein translocase subunit YajC